MERFTKTGWIKVCGAVFAGGLLVSLISFAPDDPTLTNLRYPSAGVSNLLLLPGALLGGSLVEFFGASALWIPLLIGNGLLVDSRKGAPARMVLHGSGLVLFSAAAHGLLAPEPVLGLGGAGLAGLATRDWIVDTTGSWVGWALLVWGMGYCLWRLVSISLLGAALSEGRLFFRFFARLALGRVRTAARGVAAGRERLRGTWSARRRRGALPVGVPGPPGQGWEKAPGSPAALPGGFTGDRAKTTGTDAVPPPAGKGNPTARGPGDDFDAWFSGVGHAPPLPGTAEEP